MKPSLVSVVIPAYNAENFIERALQSVLEQTYESIEVIVVDDGSIDKTENVVKSINNSATIKYCKQKNSGPSKARNTGVIEATGEYIAFLDADDVWVNKNKIQFQIETFRSNSDIVLVDTFAEIYWDKDLTTYNKRVNSKTNCQDFLYQNCINATSSVMAKRDAIIESGLFDEEISFGEDRLLWAQLSLKGALGTVHEVCVWKENHSINLTSSFFILLENKVTMMEKLLSTISCDSDKLGQVWIYNFKDAFRKAWRERDCISYKRIYVNLWPYAKNDLVFSRYTLIYPLLVALSFLAPKKY